MATELRERAKGLPSVQLSAEALADLELLASGALAPRAGFGRDFLLRVEETPAADQITLRHSTNELLGVMRVEERLPGGLGGPVEVLGLPKRYDFPEFRLTPAEARARLKERGDVAAFVARRALRIGEEKFLREREVGLLLAPAGVYKPGDFDYYTRVRALALSARCLDAVLCLVPMRDERFVDVVAGNYGAVEVVEAPAVTEEYRPEIAALLAKAHPPRAEQGFCIWFTGLPSAGKSTIADILAVLLMAHGRQVTLLDGDVVRTHLSKGLGFSRQDRDINILRLGFVASEITRHGGAVICAAVSPYRATRERVREMVGADRFVETFVDTPAGVCEQRDVKGFYAQARAGGIQGFTGVDDPYEPPEAPEVRLETTDCSPEQNARKVLAWLVEQGFLQTDNRRA